MSGVTPTPATQPNDATTKLGAVIKPYVDDAVKQMVTHMTNQTQDVLIRIGTLEVQMNRFENMLAEKKVSVPREKKTAAAQAGTNAGGAAQVTSPTSGGASVKGFPNRMRWFYDQYLKNKDFRAMYTPEDATKIIETDSVFDNEKLTEDKRLTAMAKICWNVVSKVEAHKQLVEQMNNDYNAARAAASNAPQPAQEKVEANTPV